MARNLILAAGALAALAAGSASAQSATDTKQFTVTGTVPALCSGGTISGGNSTFNLGVLVDTATGLLRTDLAAPNKVLTGAFCSSQSTITVAATPLTAQNFTATPPAGFSRAVNYTATASGWTPNAATFATGTTSNPGAVQTRTTAFSGDITVGIGTFGTSGGNALRLVADNNYMGAVTVTLTVAN
jgi:hypothetical protein